MKKGWTSLVYAIEKINIQYDIFCHNFPRFCFDFVLLTPILNVNFPYFSVQCAYFILFVNILTCGPTVYCKKIWLFLINYKNRSNCFI